MQKNWHNNPVLQKESLEKMLLSEFLTNAEICRRAGCSKFSVVNAIKNNGFDSEAVRFRRRIGLAKRRRAGGGSLP